MTAAPPVLDAGLPVRAFFTTRAGGSSLAPFDALNLANHVGDEREAVERNRAVAERLALLPVAYMSQVHGNAIAGVDVAGMPPQADAIYTVNPELAVGVLVADCVPILIHDGATGAVAAIHAGRRGVQLSVVSRALDALALLPRTGAGVLSASIGPAICGKCYEVPADMRDEVCATAPAAWSETPAGTAALDLRAAVLSQLVSSSVSHIVNLDRCTREDHEFFSHRRDGVTGRFAGIIGVDASLR